MQPLMNMITFSARDRARIVTLHTDITDALESRDGAAVTGALTGLEAETQTLARTVFAARTRPAPS
jgi:GntR family transcriptional regulator, transcriptional repressor for pyruvate dehydrogenase complex